MLHGKVGSRDRFLNLLGSSEVPTQRLPDFTPLCPCVQRPLAVATVFSTSCAALCTGSAHRRSPDVTGTVLRLCSTGSHSVPRLCSTGSHSKRSSVETGTVRLLVGHRRLPCTGFSAGRTPSNSACSSLTLPLVTLEETEHSGIFTSVTCVPWTWALAPQPMAKLQPGQVCAEITQEIPKLLAPVLHPSEALKLNIT